MKEKIKAKVMDARKIRRAMNRMTTEIIELLAPIEGEYTRVAPNAAMAAFEGTVGASAERAAARPKSPCGGIMRSEISGICVGGRLCTGH